MYQLKFGFHTSTSNYETQTQHSTDYHCEILGLFWETYNQFNELLYICYVKMQKAFLRDHLRFVALRFGELKDQIC